MVVALKYGYLQCFRLLHSRTSQYNMSQFPFSIFGHSSRNNMFHLENIIEQVHSACTHTEVNDERECTISSVDGLCGFAFGNDIESWKAAIMLWTKFVRLFFFCIFNQPLRWMPTNTHNVVCWYQKTILRLGQKQKLFFHCCFFPLACLRTREKKYRELVR